MKYEKLSLIHIYTPPPKKKIPEVWLGFLWKAFYNIFYRVIITFRFSNWKVIQLLIKFISYLRSFVCHFLFTEQQLSVHNCICA